MNRPATDVVVPFAGSAEDLSGLDARLRRLSLSAADTLVIVDNGPRPSAGPVAGRRVIHAGERPTPAYARNRGALHGHGEWIVFLDADVSPEPDLLDRLFEPPPRPRTALLAGGVRDEEVPRDGPPVGRYARLRALSDQGKTFGFRWGWPQTTNVACRRAAFEEVGGFREEIRAAEDADLTYRLARAGWEVERREHASVTHLNRATARAFARQKLVHGAGGAWLDREYPGAVPARRRLGLTWWGVRTAAVGLAAGARERDRDRVLRAVFEPLEHLAYEYGRSLSNYRGRRSP